MASLRELQEPGDTDILEEIGVLFIKHAPGKIAAMKKAASEGDAKALQVAAHSFKSSASYVGLYLFHSAPMFIADQTEQVTLDVPTSGRVKY